MRTRYLHGPRGPWRRCFYCNAELRAYDRMILFCDSCEAERRPIQSRAKDLVRRAIRAGRIAPAVGQPCADCGSPATKYDHRDYAEPLKVEPVCTSCNCKRGPARAPVGLI